MRAARSVGCLSGRVTVLVVVLVVAIRLEIVYLLWGELDLNTVRVVEPKVVNEETIGVIQDALAILIVHSFTEGQVATEGDFLIVERPNTHVSHHLNPFDAAELLLNFVNVHSGRRLLEQDAGTLKESVFSGKGGDTREDYREQRVDK